LEGHTQNVNGVAFTPNGKALISVGYDATLRIWPLPDGAPEVITLPSPLNAAAVAADGEIAAGGADGKVRFLTAGGREAGEVQAGRQRLSRFAISPDGMLIAAAGIGRCRGCRRRKARRVARTLIGPGSPVWSVAFLPDDVTLLTGGPTARSDAGMR